MLPSALYLPGIHRRGLGYTRCLPADKPQGNFALYLQNRDIRIGAASNGSSVSLAGSRAPIEDQGPTDSCPGHGTSQLCYTAAKAAGSPLAWTPSPGGIYTQTRCLQRVATSPAGAALPALVDGGAMPPYIAQAVNLFGLRPIQAPTPDGRYSDVDPTNVNVEPMVHDLESAGLCLVSGEYEIPIGAQADLETLIQTANRNNIPVGTGMFVDSAFMDWTPNLPPIASVNWADPAGGGHWMSEDGFTVTSNGNGVYDLVSSWGTSAGDQGVFRVTGACLVQAGLDYWPWAMALSPNTGKPVGTAWKSRRNAA